MKRTTKAERKQNACQFYQVFSNQNKGRTCIVVDRADSGDNHKVQFLTTTGSFHGTPFVIAESVNLGVEGCWRELIRSIHGDIEQTGYYEDGFKKFLKKTMNFEITHDDGYVYIIER